MQAYSSGFAHVYNQLWSTFARSAAPVVQAYYEKTRLGRRKRRLLDLACGTGQLARHFLEQGYRVVGLDLSPAMLELARENCAPFLADGQAHFETADAADFRVDEPVGLVVSTYDALNHLPNLAALRGCFDCVYDSLLSGGCFVFDLNTRRGLNRWNSININETDEMLIIARGIYDGVSERAYTRITGFVRGGDGRFDRFDETAYNTAFALTDVAEALTRAGFADHHFARLARLEEPLADPELEGRVFVVASKA